MRCSTRVKTVRLALEVTVPEETPDQDVVDSINRALDEPPCDWAEWIVGAVTIWED